ncbi:MAG TPA: ATP-binding cassette domain-containing protein, partial [Bacteroidales bacterium]|nr:ATP-binding cassette domain-containing protein [Bacteroidales bacterium]
LDKNDTVFDTLDKVAVGDIRTKLRDILGAFLFKGEDIDKKVAVLSGGEKSRLAMAKLILKPYNLLALDEPTNHMDIRSKDVLKQALVNYDGTLIIVSHDRDFLDGLVNKLYEFKDGKVKEHLGGVVDFLQKKKLGHLNDLEINEVAAKKERQIEDKVKNQELNSFKEQREKEREERKKKNAIERCEKAIEESEKKIKILEESLSNPKDGKTFQKQLNEYNQLKEKIEKQMEEWEKLQS